MQFKSAILASAVAMTASAAPTTPTPGNVNEGQTFGVIAIHSGSQVHNAGFQAARSGLLVNAKNQNATCDTPTNFATFYIQDTELHLYAASATPQTIFVDRSGMGQGIVGYTTGAQGAGRNSERKGWAVDADNHLTFDQTGFQACPNSIDGGWELWLSGVTNPGGYKDCVSIAARVVPTTEKAVSCLYTE